MTKKKKCARETEVQKLEWKQMRLLETVSKWLETGGPILNDEEGLRMAEMQREILQLEGEIMAFWEGYQEAYLTASWQQRMFPEVEVIPISEDEIPF